LPKKSPTNLASLARGILAWAEGRGLETGRLLSAAELAPESLTGEETRIPHEQHSALWRELTTILGDPGFGVKESESILSASSLGVVGMLAMTSRTVGESIDRSVRYGRVLREDVVARSYLTEQVLVVELRPVSPQPRAMAEASVAAFRHLLQRWSGQPIAVREVYFQHARPADLSAYERVFPCPIRFQQATNAILFDRSVSELPLTTAQPEVARYLEQLARAKLQALEAHDVLEQDLVASVRAAVREGAERGDVNLTTVARALGLSARSLQRALSEEGLEFRGLVDEARWAVAAPLLSSSELSIEEIAERLGYSDAKAFRRAFRRWAGVAPGELRNRR
jgi:AraC-like DNA-binding protein